MLPLDAPSLPDALTRGPTSEIRPRTASSTAEAARILRGLRVLLASGRSGVEQRVAIALEDHGAIVELATDRRLDGLEAFDAQVVLTPRTPPVGDDLPKRLAAHRLLRHATLVPCVLDSFAPEAGEVDVPRLAELIAPATDLDRALARRARSHASRFAVPLASLGLPRVLRALAGQGRELRLAVIGTGYRGFVEIDDHLVLAAACVRDGYGSRERLGMDAIAALADLPGGPAYVTAGTTPGAAGLVCGVDDLLRALPDQPVELDDLDLLLEPPSVDEPTRRVHADEIERLAAGSRPADLRLLR